MISRDGIHELAVQIGAYEIYNGQYQLIARYEDRNDAPYVDLPYTLTVENDPPLLPKPTITSVRETEDGKAEIDWRSNADASEIAKVRVFLHDHAKGASDQVYTTLSDFNPDDPIQIPGLARDKDYSFSMALLKEVSTRAYGKTHTLHEPGPRSETAAFRPQGPDFVGAPCVKLVDSESYATFEPDGDLFVRLRILNESETAMARAPLRIYYNHRSEENLLAAAGATQAGMSYSDVHFTIPFEHMAGLETPGDESASIVYDIETGGQDEHLTFDNAGVMEIENMAGLRNAKNNFFDTSVVLNLKQGWNLVGDAVWGEDVFRELTHGTIYSHDGTQMRENVQNRQPGGGYFVYLPRDTNVVLAGTPMAPDFSRAGDNKWQLMGTGVDIYNSLADDQDIPSDSLSYTPGKECDFVFGLQRGPDDEIQWEKNPAIIEAGSGFWCVKE